MKNKKRKIDRKHLIHTFVFALFCVFGLTVAYAALSTTLNISGSASVNSSEWSFTVTENNVSEWAPDFGDSKFTVSGNMIAYDTGSVVKKPTISGTTLNGFELSLVKPGDIVRIYYLVTNTGSIPAMYKSITNSTPTITSSTGNSSDVTWAQNNVVIESSVAAMSSEGYLATVLPGGTVVCPGESVIVEVGARVADVDSIPTAAVIFSNINTEVIFEQTDSKACPV